MASGDLEPRISSKEKREQLRRILDAPALRNAPHLRDFLEFVGQKAIDGETNGVTEYDIATHVFHRPPTFDPSNDTIVRTQAYRLRLKLKEYYEASGDPILLELPKGHYLPTFRLQANAGTTVKKSRMRWWILGVLAGVLLLLTGYALGRQGQTATFPASPALASFWRAFLGSETGALIGYTNTAFLVDDLGNMYPNPAGPVDERGTRVRPEIERLLPAPQGQVFYDDAYTGTGEVLAVHQLTRLFGQLNAPLTVRRSRLLSVEDLKLNNVVFIGSPGVNPTLKNLRLPRRFVFTAPANPPLLWHARIVNLQPVDGERQSYGVERDAQSHMITHDYAVVCVVPGLHPGRRIMVLAGLTTSGTQAAVEYVTSAKHVDALWTRIGRSAWPESMEILLRVETAKGLDVQTVEFVAGRFEPGSGDAETVK